MSGAVCLAYALNCFEGRGVARVCSWPRSSGRTGALTDSERRVTLLFVSVCDLQQSLVPCRAAFKLRLTHHCSVRDLPVCRCGAPQGPCPGQRECSCAPARTHARALTHARTHARTRVRTPPTHTHTHTHTHMHSRTHAHTYAYTHARERAHTHAQARTANEMEKTRSSVPRRRRESGSCNRPPFP